VLHDSQWERLESLAPDGVCRRALVEYDADSGRYSVPLLNRRVLVDRVGRSVEWADAGDGERPPGFTVTLMTVVYLLEAKDLVASGEWVTAEMLPAGAFFFRGPHAVPTKEIEQRYGTAPEEMLAAAARLNGTVGDAGDACANLTVLPRIPMRVVLWLGDDEFPSKVTMLFDRTADSHLALDALLCMAEYAASELVREGGEGTEA